MHLVSPFPGDEKDLVFQSQPRDRTSHGSLDTKSEDMTLSPTV